MILLTGATGSVGSALLRRLTVGEEPVRCLVRDPRRLRAERVRVQIALGDLSNPSSYRHALRGVTSVVHLSSAVRDQPLASIEELNGMATLRLVRAAERAGVERFVFLSAIGADLHSKPRFFRAKALAERAVERSRLDSVVLAASVVYTPGDRWLGLLERLSYLPVMPVPGPGRTAYQPIWADDVAACAARVLRGEGDGSRGRYELAGPDTLSHDEVVELALRSAGRRRPLLHVPLPLVRATLRSLERVVGPSAFASWDEAELMAAPMTTPRGTADAEAIGVEPLPMAEVLGAV